MSASERPQLPAHSNFSQGGASLKARSPTQLNELDYKILDFLVKKFKRRPDVFFGHTPRSVARALRLPRDLETRRAVRKILRDLASLGLLSTISVKPAIRYLPTPAGVAFVDDGGV